MKKLKDQYEKISIKPNEKTWEKIESKLDKKLSKIIPLFWKYAAAVLVVISLSVLWLNDDKADSIAEHWVIKSESEVGKISPKEMNSNVVKIEQKEKIIVSTKHKEMSIEQKELPPAVLKGETLINPVPEPIGKIKDSPKIAKKVEYTTAEDLLFGVEAQRIQTEQEKSKNRVGKIDFPKIVEPQRIEILGIKVYENSEE